MTTTGYAAINGLNLYYEIHGEEHAGTPLVLIHGGMSAIGTSFEKLIPGLSAQRRLIAFDFQAHGRTADIDRPLRMDLLATDTAALLQQLGVEQADILGYSIGSGVAVEVVRQFPNLVRRLMLVSVTYNTAGLHPGLLEGIEMMQPEHMAGTSFEQEYNAIAPRPQDFPVLIDKVKTLDKEFTGWSADTIRAIQSPTLLVIGDSDIVQPEHAVEMFRMLGGGVMGDMAGLPRCQLAILPGTTHITVVHRAEWLVPMIGEFLDRQVDTPR
jgi:pimeloyl-ACP methyl ester carboxylesterase